MPAETAGYEGEREPGDRTERRVAAAEREGTKNAARRAVRTVEEPAVG